MAIAGSSTSVGNIVGRNMKKVSIEENKKNISFLLENWDILNVKDIMKLYASGKIF